MHGWVVGASLMMLEAHYQCLKSLWIGQAPNSGISAIGWRDYLLTVESGDALVMATEAQLMAIGRAFR